MVLEKGTLTGCSDHGHPTTGLRAGLSRSLDIIRTVFETTFTQKSFKLIARTTTDAPGPEGLLCLAGKFENYSIPS